MPVEMKHVFFMKIMEPPNHSQTSHFYLMIHKIKRDLSLEIPEK